MLSAFHGLCMALADSVPGVSGGTIAFILGFYDDLLRALQGLFNGKGPVRRQSLRALLRFGIGWGVGMAACILALAEAGMVIRVGITRVVVSGERGEEETVPPGLVQALMELITSAGVVEALEVQKFIQDAFLIQGLAALASCA